MGITTREPRARRRLARGAALAVAACLALPTAGSAATLSCLATPAPPASTGGPLQFGIYPGGTAGSVAGKADPAPEDPAARNAALQELRGSRALGVHIYTAYTGDAAADAGTAIWLDGEIAGYTAAGLKVELVVRYKPRSTDAGAAVAGFTAAVRELVRRYGADPGFTSLQVTNEANLTGAPDASDGAFPGALDALVQGVVAAKDEVVRSGHRQVQVGFNWAVDGRPADDAAFWTALGRRGGAAFAGAVDWVGVDSYPGTFAPALALTSLLPQLTGDAVTTALHDLRACQMPAAGLGPSVPVHVSENGFPTGSGRSEATQAQVLEQMVRVVDRVRTAYNVTAYNWFDLRDSRTGDASIESHYGLMHDDYSPKPAFDRYRDLIAELSAAPASAVPTAEIATAACSPSPVTVRLPRPAGMRVHVVRIRQANRVVKTVRRSRSLPVTVRIALAPGRARLSLRLQGRRHGRPATRVVHRAVHVC